MPFLLKLNVFCEIVVASRKLETAHCLRLLADGYPAGALLTSLLGIWELRQQQQL